MRYLVVLLLAASATALDPCGSTIFVATMDGGLDGYIRARMIEQSIPLTIVTDKSKADLIMTGSSQQLQDHWYAGAGDKDTGEITIADKNGNVVWSAAAGDRNIWWGRLAKHGPEKVAERIVAKLKTQRFLSCAKEAKK
jgi:hypothetical protein